VVRRSLFALAACVLALGLAACGGVKETIDPVAQAADKSAGAGGVNVHLDAAFTVAGQSASFSADGAFDGNEGEMTLDFGSLFAQAGLGGDGTAKVVSTEEGGKQIVYMQMPALTGMFLPAGKTWMKLDVQEAAKSLGTSGSSSFLGASNQNPAEAFELLKKVASVTEVGHETLDGVATTHYRADVDVESALTQAGAPASALEAVKSAGLGDTIPVDVWVGDDDGYIRKFTISYDAAAMGQTLNGEMTMTLSDYGSDVSVEAPPSDQVFDATSLVSGLASLGGGKP
jgi:hypothetical protein